MNDRRFSGMRVTVMGLGAHGGGADTARYLVSRGAEVTVTDLRGESELADSLESIADLPVRLVLGRHDAADFRDADVVVKNPAVPRTSPFLGEARRIETDVSFFLAEFAPMREQTTRPPAEFTSTRAGFAPMPAAGGIGSFAGSADHAADRGGERSTGTLVAITGTKGKSTTATATAHILRCDGMDAHLGGNITVSPLRFLTPPLTLDHGADGSPATPASQLPQGPVVLELSSFQLGDLRLVPGGIAVLRPDVSTVTSIYRDHMNYYHGDFGAYIRDKAVVCASQPAGTAFVYEGNSRWGRFYAGRTKARGVPVFPTDGDTPQLPTDPRRHPVRGPHAEANIRLAAAIARTLGVAERDIAEGAASFPGVPHRMEFVREVEGVAFYNDSAATIPEAAVAAVRAFADRGFGVHLIAGGTDKELDMRPLALLREGLRSLRLLAGTATQKLVDARPHTLPPTATIHDSLADAVAAASSGADRGDVVLLSPGCASFGMFRNEFDRGNRFRALVPIG